MIGPDAGAPAPLALVGLVPPDVGAPAPASVLAAPGRRPGGWRWTRRVALAVGVAAVVTGTGYAVALAGSPGDARGPGVVEVGIDIDRSEFSTRRIRVREGTLLHLEVRNLDPIAHELVVGDEAVHRAHATGEERRHPPRPGEVSVGPGATGTTFVVLDEPGTYAYACHLPGHVAYGMTGEVEVIPAD